MKNKTLLIFISALITFQVSQLKSQIVEWTKLIYTPSQVLYSVYCFNQDTVITVGKNGYIIKSENGGNNWDSIASNTSNDLYKVFFVDKAIGYACGEKGTILKTTDAGQNWTNISISTNLDFFSISFINKDTGWVAGGIGNLYSTYGNKGILLKTINGGNNWIVDSTYNKTIASVFFIDNDTGYICTNNSYNSVLKKTTNGGISYSILINDSSVAEFHKDIFFPTNKTGYFFKSGINGGIYKTCDYGNSWNKILSQWGVKSLFVFDTCSIYISYHEMPGEGSYGIDSCTHTILDYTAFFWNMSFIDMDRGYGVGSGITGNYIYKRGLLTDIIEENSSSLITLFPNPLETKITIIFNPSFNLSNISIKIINSLGQEIISKEKIEENHLMLDLSEEKKGCYFLSIKYGNKIVYSSKLIKH